MYWNAVQMAQQQIDRLWSEVQRIEQKIEKQEAKIEVARKDGSPRSS